MNDAVFMQSPVIQERAFEFACRVVKLCERLHHGGIAGRHIAWQLIRSGTSVGSNAEEAEEAQTKPDFIAKLAIARKEARESGFWLRLAIACAVVTRDEIAWELDEARQLKAMLVAAIKTAQSRPWRG